MYERGRCECQLGLVSLVFPVFPSWIPRSLSFILEIYTLGSYHFHVSLTLSLVFRDITSLLFFSPLSLSVHLYKRESNRERKGWTKRKNNAPPNIDLDDEGVHKVKEERCTRRKEKRPQNQKINRLAGNVLPVTASVSLPVEKVKEN